MVDTGRPGSGTEAGSNLPPADCRPSAGPCVYSPSSAADTSS